MRPELRKNYEPLRTWDARSWHPNGKSSSGHRRRRDFGMELMRSVLIDRIRENAYGCRRQKGRV
jgi:hypothetical protein